MRAKKFASVFFAVIIALSCFSAAAYAQTSYISEIAVAVGSDSISSLENQGYTVLFQGMNLVTESDSAVYLGYKKGDSAVTDLIVSDKKSDAITVEGTKYTLVSDISLNQGTTGTPIYLYYTKDSKSGYGLVALETAVITEDSGSLDSVFNDGSSPVLDDNGKLANLEKGIENSGLYLKKIYSNSMKPYISKATLVSGASREEALLNAANGGYCCFLDKSLTKNSYTYLVYNRTADKAEALTGLYIADGNSAFDGYAVSGSAGSTKLFTRKVNNESPLLDIYSSSIFSGSFTLGDWATFYFAGLPLTGAKSIIMQENEYNTLKKSKSECSCVICGTSENGTAIYGIYCGKTNLPTAVSPDVTETTFEASTEATTVIESGEEATDSIIENEKSEISSEETTDMEKDSTVSSALGNGNVTVIISVSLILIIGIAITVIIRKRKENQIG